MSRKSINSSPRLIQHLVATRAFQQKPLVVVDVGARGGFEPHWDSYGDQVELIGFEPEVRECERLNQLSAGSGKRVFPIALHDSSGKKKFYVTQYPSSSGFYLPEAEFWQRFLDGDRLSVVKTLEMETVDFSSFARKQRIDYVDFMKLDTEGSELDIMKGAVEFLKKSVLGLSIEVEFFPVHKGQPVFSDIDPFLQAIGFRLFDMAVSRLDRKVLPVMRSSLLPAPLERGQITCGQALYLKDGVTELGSLGAPEDGWSDIRILKLASFMELFCLPDCAVELLQTAGQKGLLPGDRADNFIDMLVPRMGRKTVSYNEYLERFRVARRRGYVNGREYLRQKATQFLPTSLRRIIGSVLAKTRDEINDII